MFRFRQRVVRLLGCYWMGWLLLLCTAGCAAQSAPPEASAVPSVNLHPPAWEQTLQHLYLPTQPEPAPSQPIRATWIPYFLYTELLAAPDTETARSMLRTLLQQSKAFGIQTIFAHVCAFGESYYPSAIYARSGDCRVDLLAWLCEECDALGLSLHAWINPLRLQTDSALANWSADRPIAAWYADPETKGRYLVQVGDRWYLNPAYPAVRELLSNAVTELLTNYPIDGVHIDDYFYPTTDPAFDAEAFAAAGATDRSQWRIETIHQLVSDLYDAVHTATANAIFSISPQGNLQSNRTSQFADPAHWCANSGYCDWLIPQLYYGYQNETLPFPKALAEWQALPRDASVALLVGLATYKVGSVDVYAGTGKTEWQTETGIPAREATAVLQDPSLAGVALYHLQTTLQLPADEQSALRASLS